MSIRKRSLIAKHVEVNSGKGKSVNNQSVTDKNGNKVFLCSYKYVDYDGSVETCRHAQGCYICGGCSRIDTAGHEHGHCTGHLGLNMHIEVPGQASTNIKAELENARSRRPQRKRREKKGPKVNVKPSLKV